MVEFIGGCELVFAALVAIAVITDKNYGNTLLVVGVLIVLLEMQSAFIHPNWFQQ